MSEQPKKPGYRDTLNLPVTEFPMKADLATREPQRLAGWDGASRYAELRDRRAGRPVWLLHDGPPYSNGHLHMGTAANKIWKDAAVRQASLAGFDAPYVPGWDNHGMPIETQVGREFAREEASSRPGSSCAAAAASTRASGSTSSARSSSASAAGATGTGRTSPWLPSSRRRSSRPSPR